MSNSILASLTPYSGRLLTRQKPVSGWQIIPITDGLLALFDPCRICFPGGETNNFVTSSDNHGTVLHWPTTVSPSGVRDR
ncbi:hypothetical protein SAMN05421858_3701 [Haladaptatus litoreus]|uniref:Uncharacterized protein n=1 Tax=Haladaptatus litoreus TaxID=553468 RepID=A0A1N7DKU5_9EURY|nr:hypothetical protein SAMN05421858_3701 [Haladaptatus litoreus]